jgi:hypothetical protein
MVESYGGKIKDAKKAYPKDPKGLLGRGVFATF